MAETWKFSGPDNTPTEAEKRLIEAAEAGGIADCTDLNDNERVVSPTLIVAVATGKLSHKYDDGSEWSLHPHGMLLSGARIVERLVARERRFPASVRFNCCIFERAVSFTGSVVDGALSFIDCHLIGESGFSEAEIAGQFSVNGSFFENPLRDGGAGRAIIAQELSAIACFMSKTKVRGEFNLTSAKFAGHFNANGATFENPLKDAGYGCAVRAQGVTASNWFMNHAEVLGEFDINASRFSGQFNANDSVFTNPLKDGGFGRAVRAQEVAASAWFMDRVKVRGQISINNAKFSGQVSIVGAKIENPQGTAIFAQRVQVDAGVFVSGTDEIVGLVDFAHSKIGVGLVLANAHLSAGGGDCALSLNQARVDGELRMPFRFPKGIVDLSRAHAATLVDAARSWPKPLALDCRDGGRQTREVKGRVQDIEHMVLDGFTYDHIEYPAGHPKAPAGAVGKARIDWLNGQSAQDLMQHFNPQPWRQMAKVLREMGYEKAAQEVSIARRVRERHADGVGWFERFINWFLENVADYGFNPWKTVRISAYFVVLSAFIYWGGAGLCGKLEAWDSVPRLACSGQPAFVQTKFNDFEERVKLDKVGKLIPDPNIKDAFEKERPGYPAFNPLAYSLDVFLPLLDIQSEAYWRANTKAYWTRSWLQEHPVLEVSFRGWRYVIGKSFAIGWLLYLWSVFEVFMGSILIAIAVTGFTGLLTRDEK